MTYLQARNNSGQNQLRRILLVAGVLLVLILGGVLYFAPHVISAFMTTLARPFWRVESSIEMGSLRSRESLLIENEYLKRELEAADVRLLTVGAVEMENAELKAGMGRASSTPYTLAAVLKHPPQAPYDELVIDIGQDFGLKEGNLVYAAGMVPIGKVVEIFGETSKIRLFSSPEERYEVEIGSGRSAATAIGRGGGQYEAQLPRDIKISEGDLVVVPAISTKPFAIVSAVLSDPVEPFQTILFAPPVGIYGLHWVWVDSNHKKK